MNSLNVCFWLQSLFSIWQGILFSICIFLKIFLKDQKTNLMCIVCNNHKQSIKLMCCVYQKKNQKVKTVNCLTSFTVGSIISRWTLTFISIDLFNTGSSILTWVTGTFKDFCFMGKIIVEYYNYYLSTHCLYPLISKS